MTQSFWLFGSRLTVVADRTATDGKYDLIDGYFPPGTQTPPHRHTRYSEQLYVLEGEFTVKTVSQDTNGTYSLIEMIVYPQTGSPPHIHSREDEPFFIQSGAQMQIFKRRSPWLPSTD